MKIKISELNPNPFKKEINKGKLNNNRVELLQESIEHGTLPEHFFVRNNNGKYELTSGHHRIEALKRSKGKNYQVDVTLVNYNDEKMLIDLVRENITQRDTDFKDNEDSMILAKRWLESEGSTVKSLYSTKKGGYPTHKIKEIGSRQIALFLSKQGKTISHTQIEKYLNIAEDLIPDIRNKLTKGSQGHTEEGKIGLELGSRLAKFKPEEQKPLFEMVKKSINKDGLSEEKAKKLLSSYNESSDEIKKRVLNEEIELTDVPIENFKAEIKKKIEQDNKNNKNEIKVYHYKKLTNEASNRVGTTNEHITTTLAYLDGLDKTGILHNLEWKTIYKILEVAADGGKEYSKITEKIMRGL